MDWGEALTRWTARLAVGGYLGRVLLDVAGPQSDAWRRRARRLWTAGAVVLLLHVLAALHFEHHWRQAAAVERVRQQTRALVGWDSGAGLYVNYLFTLLWLVDAALWGRRLDWPQRRIPYWIVQGTFAFVMFNATVVFGPWWWRLVAAIFGAAALVVFKSASGRTSACRVGD